MKERILSAMRADSIPEDSSGLWTVKKRAITAEMAYKTAIKHGRACHPGSYTFLYRLTNDTLMNAFPGDVVMNDMPCELKTHLDFCIKAKGKILVGGLGLGCVVRGLLVNDNVTSIDVIERDRNVIKLCGNSISHPKVTIHWGDAWEDQIDGGPWDRIWWDLWSDKDRDEPALSLIHMRLIHRFRKRCTKQGAWAFPRKYRRSLRHKGVL